jgi:hypothetical protein
MTRATISSSAVRLGRRLVVGVLLAGAVVVSAVATSPVSATRSEPDSGGT